VFGNNKREIDKKIERVIEMWDNQGHKEGVLEVYEDLIGTIWSQILPSLGWITAMAVMERALTLTQEQYPLVEHLKVTRNGLNFVKLRGRIGDETLEDLKEGLKEVVVNLIDVLAMIAGDVLVKGLLQEIEKKNLDSKSEDTG